jgi:hypothetical protein
MATAQILPITAPKLHGPISSLDLSDGPDSAIVARAQGLFDLIRSHAAQGEADRRVAQPVIDALQEDRVQISGPSSTRSPKSAALTVELPGQRHC